MLRRILLTTFAIGVAGLGALLLKRLRSSADVTGSRDSQSAKCLPAFTGASNQGLRSASSIASLATPKTSIYIDLDGIGPVTRGTRRESISAMLGLGVWAGAVLLAFIAQYELTPLKQIAPAGILYAAAAILLVVGAALIDRRSPLPDPMQYVGPGDALLMKDRSTWRRLGGTIGITLGLLLTASSAYTLAVQNTSTTALPLWILALCALVVGVGLFTSFPWRLPRSRRSALELAGVIALIGVAFAFRFWNLVEIPLDVHGDEGAVGIAAREIINGDVKNIFGLGWTSQPQLSFATAALSLKAFGNDLFGLRMASVIPGCLSVGLLYGVAKRLFSARVATLAAILLASAQMANHYSRIGNNYIQALFASLLLFYFLLRALLDRHWLDYLLAGFSVGLTLSVYIAARLTPVLLVLYVLHRAISERQFVQRHWKGLIVLVVGACLFMAPQIVFYSHDPSRALDRTSGVFVLQPDNLDHEYGVYHVHSAADVLRMQAINTIEAFNLRGETSLQYGQLGPLLDFWSGTLFVLGVALATTRIWQPRYFLLAMWLWLTLLLGSVMSVDAMFSPHIVALLGILAIFPALIVDTGWRGLADRFGKWGGRMGLAIAIAFALVTTYANYVDYFFVHTSTMESPGFFTVLARYILTINDRYRVYLLADQDTSLRYDTTQFLIPHLDGVDARNFPLHLPLDRIPAQKGVIFIERNRQDPRYAAIKAQYPRGIEQAHPNPTGFIEFYSYQVEHADLLAADPQAYIDHTSIPAVDLNQLSPP